MGVFSGPDVSESGLVLALDVANTKSYPDAVNYYSTPETLTEGRVGTDSGGIYTDFTSGGPDGGRFTRWTNNTGTSGSTAWHWGIGYSNTGLTTGQLVVISFYARCPNGTVSSITLNSPDSTIVTATLDTSWRLFTGVALYGGDYVSTPFVRINRSNTNTFANGATYDIALLKVQKGNVLTDMTGRGNTGTLTNGPTYSSANGGSIVFDGTNDNIQLGNTSNIVSASQSQITVNAWVKTNVVGAYKKILVNVTAGTASITGIYFSIGPSPYNTYFGVTTSGGQNSATYTQDISTTSYTNLCGTYDGSNIRLYLNGTLVATQALTGTLGTGGITRISGYDNNAETWNGNISQVSIYNRELTAAEVRQNFNASKSRYGL